MSMYIKSGRGEEFFQAVLEDFFDLSTIEELVEKRTPFLIKSVDRSKKLIHSIIMMKCDTKGSLNNLVLICSGHYKEVGVKRDPVRCIFKLFIDLVAKELFVSVKVPKSSPVLV